MDDELGDAEEKKDESPEKKKSKRALYIGVAASVAALILTYILFVRKKSTSTTSTQVVTTGTTTAPTASAATSPSAAPSTVDITTPGGGSYTGPPTSVPTSIATTKGGAASATTTPTRTSVTTSTGSSYTGPSATAPKISPSQGTPTTDTSYSTLIQMGQGYSVGRTGHLASGTVKGRTGGTYSTLASYTTTLNAIQNGQTVAYQSAPGVFTPIKSVTQFKAIEPAGKAGGPTDTTTYVLSPSSRS